MASGDPTIVAQPSDHSSSDETSHNATSLAEPDTLVAFK